jgi:hypothetical protein
VGRGFAPASVFGGQCCRGTNFEDYARVMPAEHLVAIALRTGRAKDHARIVQFIEQDAVGRVKLSGLLERHGLLPRWTVFEKNYLGGGRE